MKHYQDHDSAKNNNRQTDRFQIYFESRAMMNFNQSEKSSTKTKFPSNNSVKRNVHWITCCDNEQV